MSDTKEFHISDVITAATGTLVSLRHMDGVYDILGWLTDSQPFTHQLPRLSREAEPFLRAQFPALTAEPIPPITSMEDVEAWMSTLYPRYGQTVEVPRMPAEDHTHIDPITELAMKMPHAEIVAVVTPEKES